MNSILQILRFTPGFTQSLASLAKEIKISMEERKLIVDMSKFEEDENDNLTWKIVLNMNAVSSYLFCGNMIKGFTIRIFCNPDFHY